MQCDIPCRTVICVTRATVSGVIKNARIRLILRRDHTSDAALELAVLGGVDEGVDAAVGEHQNHAEVVEPAEHEGLFGAGFPAVPSTHFYRPYTF